MARLAMKPSLKGRALRLLSQREHSRKELEQKLKPHEETPGELTEALDFLAAKDFINEKRVVESVVNRRSTKLGAARVRPKVCRRTILLMRCKQCGARSLSVLWWFGVRSLVRLHRMHLSAGSRFGFW